MLSIKCEPYLAEVRSFADSLGLREQLEGKLKYLAEYGESPEPEYRCDLYQDFAPHSFAFSIYRKLPGDEWRFWLNGGLIYQGPGQPADGNAPTFTVSLAEGHGWFVHT